jgi:hypothetical protein
MAAGAGKIVDEARHEGEQTEEGTHQDAASDGQNGDIGSCCGHNGLHAFLGSAP